MGNSTPKISVIVPVHNEERYVGRCLRSLLNQSLPDDQYEIIVIDDFSLDNTAIILDQYIGSIVMLKNMRNLGLPASLNKGILKAKGQYIVRVDGDDYVHHEYLNILSIHLSLNNDLDAVACDYNLVDKRQNVITHKNCMVDPIGCGIMYRIEQLIDIGLYNEEFLVREDEEINLRFTKKYAITRIPIPLYKYFLHHDNITSNEKMMNEFKDRLGLIRDDE